MARIERKLDQTGIDRDGPCPVILDEVDTFLNAENRRGIGILNAGHSRAGAHVEVTKSTSDGFEPKLFCVWAPVVCGLHPLLICWPDRPDVLAWTLAL